MSTSGIDQALQRAIDEWRSLDAEGSSETDLQTLIDNNDITTLRRRLLGPRMEFGTAGLRAPSVAFSVNESGKVDNYRQLCGYNCMNDVTVIQTTQGLLQYVLTQSHPEAPSSTAASARSVVIGYDARTYSRRFAELAAKVFVSAGVEIHLFSTFVPTPFVSFAIPHLGAQAGVMVTASHNPRPDNGYKLYDNTGCQIVSPIDAFVASAIERSLSIPTSIWQVSLKTSMVHDPLERISPAYYAHLETLFSIKPSELPQTPIVYTALHGVGQRYINQTFKALGLSIPIPTNSQAEPDHTFPTVAFPNPEEHGALDEAIATANSEGAQYIIANDPDADRFQAAQKLPDGSWRIFKGDELGAIFGVRALERYKEQHDGDASNAAFVTSTVCSRLLERVASEEGFTSSDCLTGFKWIGRTASDLRKQGRDVLVSYEEALGYAFSPIIADKDGIQAALAFVELLGHLSKTGRTVAEFLEAVYDRYGHFQTSNSYLISTDPEITSQIFGHLRAFATEDGQGFPGRKGVWYPKKLGEFEIYAVRDLKTNFAWDTSAPDGKPTLPVSSSNMITFRARDAENDDVVLSIRTSGTEPKIKYYLEGRSIDRARLQRKLQDLTKTLTVDWLQASKFSLKSPEDRAR